jgi:hypothetical protein
VLFPFDTQICKLGIESYGYTADQVVYQWSKGQINALTLKLVLSFITRFQKCFSTR